MIHRTLTDRADVVGTTVPLGTDQAATIALHRAGRLPNRRGTVVILHAPGSTSDDPEIVRPLRLGLSDAGWDTLSVQLPRRFVSESPQQWLERNRHLEPVIAGAAQWLRESGQLNQVLIGVGASGRAVLDFATRQPGNGVQALVLIGTSIEADSDAAVQLAGSTLPVLDLSAERDRAPVLASRSLKRRLGNANPAYRQREVPGATAGFIGLEDVMVSAIRAWLAANSVNGAAMLQ